MGWSKKKDVVGKSANDAYTQCIGELRELFRQSAREARAQFEKTMEKLKSGDKNNASLLAHFKMLQHEMIGFTVRDEAWQLAANMQLSVSLTRGFYMNYLYLNYVILHLKKHEKPSLTDENLSKIEENKSILSLSELYTPEHTLSNECLQKLYKYVFRLPENEYGFYMVSAKQMMSVEPIIF